MNKPATQRIPSSDIFFTQDTKHFNLWWQATFLMLGFFIISLILLSLDQRQLDNASVWAKPLKFESSLALYFITLAILSAYLPAKVRDKATWRWATRLGVIAGIGEVIYIVIQAARGRASHYNNETQIESIMYGVMGLGAVILVLVSFYLGWLLFHDYRKEKNDIFKLASAHGLIIGSVLTLIIAATMSSGTSHFAGTPSTDSIRVPIFGWVLSGGDLRIPHFFATHLMQFMPLYGLLLQRRAMDAAIAVKKVNYFSMVFSAIIFMWFAISLIAR